MDPRELAKELNRLAISIEHSVAPSRSMIANHIRRLITAATSKFFKYTCNNEKCNGLYILSKSENKLNAKCPKCRGTLVGKEVEKQIESDVKDTMKSKMFKFTCDEHEPSFEYFSNQQIVSSKCPLCEDSVKKPTAPATSGHKRQFMKGDKGGKGVKDFSRPL